MILMMIMVIIVVYLSESECGRMCTFFVYFSVGNKEKAERKTVKRSVCPSVI